MSRRLWWWGLVSLAVHALAWLVLVFGPGLVGRAVPAPPEPAAIEVEIGSGGAEGPPAAEAPPPQDPAPEPPEPEPPEPEQRAEEAALPALPAPQSVVRALPQTQAPPRRPPAAAPGGPAAVRLGDGGQPPYADLLDPEHNRFRAATRDSGNRMPAYPRDAALRLEAGTVKLQLFVDPAGRVVNVLVARSSGSASLDRAAREQALTWHFSPARRDGVAVPDIVEIEIEFKLI